MLGPLSQTMHITDLAKQLGMTQPGVGYAVSRGGKIAKEHKYQLQWQFLLIYGRPVFLVLTPSLRYVPTAQRCRPASVI